MDAIKKNLETGKLLYGMKQTIKALRRSEVAKIFIASNCPEIIADDIAYYGSFGDVPIEKLDIDCNELGVTCKKPFMVSVLALKK